MTNSARLRKQADRWRRDSPVLLTAAVALCQQVGLLINDALIVAVMQANGLTNLASPVA